VVAFFHYNVTGFREKSLAGHQGSGLAQQLMYNDGDVRVQRTGCVAHVYLALLVGLRSAVVN